MARKTPQTLPATGRVFSITLPEGEEWFALFMGALMELCEVYRWVESDGGLTPEETVAAFLEAFEGVRYDTGV